MDATVSFLVDVPEEIISRLPLVRALFPFKDWNTFAVSSKARHLCFLICHTYNMTGILENMHVNEHHRYLVLKTKQEQSTEYLDKEISSHYRSVVLKVHPDRQGNKYTDKFYKLQEAYQQLKHQTGRQEYIAFMLINTEEKLTRKNLEHTHDLWLQQQSDISHVISAVRQAMQKYRERRKEIKATEKDTPKNKRHSQHLSTRMEKVKQTLFTPQKPLLIEADATNRVPRRPRLRKLDAKNAIVEIEWDLLFESFHASCKKVVLLLDDDIKMEVTKKELNRLYNEEQSSYRKTIRLDSWGDFAISWYAEFVVNGETRTTLVSEPLNVKVLHPVYVNARSEQPILREAARRHTGYLRHELADYRKQKASIRDRATLVEQETNLRTGIGRAKVIIRKLSASLAQLEIDECQEIQDLQQTITEANESLSKIVRSLESLQKKDCLKAAKQKLAFKLESEDATAWLMTVSADELSNEGTDANRLFQLLTEGKTANSWLLSPITLQIAAGRDDLFSEKQRLALQERHQLVVAAQQAEVDRLVKAEMEFLLKEEKLKAMAKKKTEEEEQPPPTTPTSLSCSDKEGSPDEGAKASQPTNTPKEVKIDTAPGSQFLFSPLGAFSSESIPGETIVPEICPLSSIWLMDSNNDNHSSSIVATGLHFDEKPVEFGIGPPPQTSLLQMNTDDKPSTEFTTPSISPICVTSPDIQSKPKNSASTESPSNEDVALFTFLAQQEDSLKSTAKEFYDWLLSEDVESLDTLREAVKDDDFMGEMKEKWIKGFKKAAFKKHLEAFVDTDSAVVS